VALLGAPLSVPALLWGDGGRAVVRYSFEYGLAVLAVIAAARTRRRRVARWAAVAAYPALLVFLVYAYAFESSFHRAPALVEDWRLAINLVHFLEGMTSLRWVAAMLGALVGVVLLVVLLNRALAALQEQHGAAPGRRLGAATAAWVLLGGVSAKAGGPLALASGTMVDNYRASMAARERLRPLGEGGRDPRYQELMKVRLTKKPNVYFLVVEAYGEILTTWDMADAYRALMARVQARLAAAGYRMRTGFSAAPVHGGRSWLSLATMQTGILIDQPESFSLVKERSRELPTLIGFLRKQGYHTASLEPGTKDRAGVGSDDLYAHDLRVAGPQLDYQGKAYGWGVIPDRFSLETFRARHLDAVPEPRYVFYMAVSTHYPWTRDTVPSYEGGADWPPLEGESRIATDYRLHYVKSVEYEWRALADFLEADRSRDAVIVVLGDHQPRLESNAPGDVTFHTPVHILSKDGGFVESFAELGLQPGLHAEPGRSPPLNHEALFSLLVTKLAAAYGTPETKQFARYFPEGISLRGLNP
jgi:hypothetical protein